ncbi:MAG: phosphate/phosphite/phosphonate ABC transporter substrate-binding protein [Gammaproteobacteria bacterium]|nr:phosphate/phosphite/phosphonate ABC transporter substrate-binding protein [Gammaproteobacteria bacterium]
MHRKATVTWLVAIILYAIAGTVATPADDKPLTLGIFPRWSAQITVRDFTPLAELLTRELGRPVRIETDKDFDSFMRRVYAKEFDIVHLNQMQYLNAHDKVHYRLIAKICDNPTCVIKAVIIVRKDRNINKLGDLKGKIIAFADPNATVSYVLAKSLLRASDIQPPQYKTIFVKNPPNAVLAVYNGEADAAGVGWSVLLKPEIRQRIDVNQFNILAESRPLPHLPIAVRADMNTKLMRKIQKILITLRQRADGRAALQKIGLDRIEAAKDYEYNTVRELIHEEHISH